MKYKKYLALGKITLLDNYSHVADSLFSGVFVGIVLFIFLNIWRAAYAGEAAVEGFTIVQIIWYLALAEVIAFASGTGRIERLGEEIRNGSLASALLKPWSFIGKELTIMTANFISIFITTGIIAFIVAYFLVGVIYISLITIPFMLIILGGAAILGFAVVASFALLALWIEDVAAILWIYQKIVFIAGGMLIPLDFYPIGVQNIIQYLPTTFLMYWPAKLFVHFSWQNFTYAFLGQIIWIIITGVIMMFIYKKGIRKVGIYGG